MQAQSQFVKALVDGGQWTKLGYLLVPAIHSNDNNEALINWINPSEVGSIEGTVTFTPYQGFTGNGIDGYIKSGHNPRTAGVMKKNDASLGFYRRNDNAAVAGTYPCSIGADSLGYTTLYIRSEYDNGKTGSNVLGAVPAYFSEPNGNMGMYISSRTASNETKIYFNKTLKGTSTVTNSGDPANVELYILAYNKNGTAEAGTFSPDQCSLAFAGSKLIQDDVDTIVDAFNAFFLT